MIEFVLALLIWAHPAAKPASAGTIDPALLHGKWKVKFMYHISNGKKSEGSGPLLDAFWSFKTDGTYEIRASIHETGTYQIKGTSLLMDADHPLVPAMDKRTYNVVTLDKTHLTLSIPIAESASLTMVDFTDFVKEQ